MFLASWSPPAEDAQPLLKCLSPGRHRLGGALGSKGRMCIQHRKVEMMMYIVLT